MKRNSPNTTNPLVAKSQVQHVRQALRLAMWMQSEIERSGCDSTLVELLLKDLKQKELHLSQVLEKRIEGRLKTKSGPHRSYAKTIHLYLDESGSESLNAQSDDFVVAGIAITDEEQERYIESINSVKSQFLGDAQITLHEPYASQCSKEFRILGSSHEAFMSAANEVFREINYVAFSVCIRKRHFENSQLVDHNDWLEGSLYDLAVSFILERFVDFLSSMKSPVRGRVHFESIGSHPDALRQRAYAELLIRGTQWVSNKSFLGSLETGCLFEPKSGSSPSEIADALARCMFEWVRSDCVFEPDRFKLFSSKIHARGDNQRGKFGLKVFPDTHVRERILEHREEWRRLEAPSL